MARKKNIAFAGLVFAGVAALILVVSSLASLPPFGFETESARLTNAQRLSDPDAASNDFVAFNYSTGMPGDADTNIDLILGNNKTRDAIWDSNPFRDVPMDQIEMDDLTIQTPGSNNDPYFIRTDFSGDKKGPGASLRIDCGFSHFAYDDPLVHPGQPGRAHLHMFFGNTNTNAFSTFDSLLNSGSGSCNGEDLNRTAYWVPALLDGDGNALLPWRTQVYYKNLAFTLDGRNDTVIPLPDDLGMIAGNAGATSPQNGIAATGPNIIDDHLKVVGFHCAALGAGDIPRLQKVYSPTINGVDCLKSPSQPDNLNLEMRVSFPACWDPNKGTYRSDQTHMSYTISGHEYSDCPASHPVKISTITYRIYFDVGRGGESVFEDWFLSSDYNPQTDRRQPGGTTAHGDWWGAWHPETMDTWVDICNNTPSTDCSLGYLNRTNTLALKPHQRYRSSGGVELNKVNARDLVELCPAKQWDGSANEVSYCLRGSHSN